MGPRWAWNLHFNKLLREGWHAAIHGVSKSRTRLSNKGGFLPEGTLKTTSTDLKTWTLESDRLGSEASCDPGQVSQPLSLDFLVCEMWAIEVSSQQGPMR